MPASNMKSAMIHWAPGENAAIESACVEKPPVGIVAKACASASYGVIASSRPSQPSEASSRVNRIVSPMYRTHSIRAVSRIRSPRAAISGPGSSDSIICRPPTRSRGRTATARMMIPMPPSHCVNWRHIESERESSSKSVTTLAPVVVAADMPSR